MTTARPVTPRLGTSPEYLLARGVTLTMSVPFWWLPERDRSNEVLERLMTLVNLESLVIRPPQSGADALAERLDRAHRRLCATVTGSILARIKQSRVQSGDPNIYPFW